MSNLLSLDKDEELSNVFINDNDEDDSVYNEINKIRNSNKNS